MEKKLIQWKVKGMNQDASASAFSNEFAFENHNLRLSTNENNTLMSWVNERGTLEMSIVDKDNNNVTLQGTPIGTAVINEKLVLFTTKSSCSREDVSDDKASDHIYVLEYAKDKNGYRKDNVLECKTLYEGNINLSTLNPLETLVSYEADYIRKVYWLDGRNQPRIINIENEEFLAKDTLTDSKGIDTRFDFVPSVDLKETVSIVKQESANGTFAPGTIQYCFTYINKYQQQSSVVYASPLYYLSHTDRGAAPDEKVVCSFVININNIDERFDYIRLYAIQRTSADDVPYVRIVEDIDIEGSTVQYVDNGTTGSVLDPQELLYVGGKEVTAKTFAEKDNTLFIGNLEQKNYDVSEIQNYFDGLRNTEDNSYEGIEFANDKILTLDRSTGVYAHTNTLKRNQREITTFKGGETYRFGFQLQKATGEWSEPIFLGDNKNLKYPDVNIFRDTVRLVSASADIDISKISSTKDFGIYRRIRPCIVFPNISDRNVLCQGVLNPTVFNVEDRKDGYPFAQASWYFRPYCTEDENDSKVVIDDEDSLVEKTSKNIRRRRDREIPPTTLNGGLRLTEENSAAVYVLSGTVDPNSLEAIRRNRYIALYSNDTRGNKNYHKITHRIFGIVDISNVNIKDTSSSSVIGNTGINRYIFLSTEPWQKPGTEENEYNYNALDKDGSVGNPSTYIKSFQLYNRVNFSSTELNVYFYDNNAENESLEQGYVFYCTDNENSYLLGFENLYEGGEESDEGQYHVVQNTAGNSVAFKHYDSLQCMFDGDDNYSAKAVEIQGSVETYNTPYGNKVDDVDSNTQFFVDQSIVTLNSPDAEFDTELQSFGSEGLKMRIVGAIPITASISAHKITTSSNMLEVNLGGSSTSDIGFGSGEKDILIKHSNIDTFACRRLVAEYLWNDVSVTDNTSDIKTANKLYNYLIYPWHRSGALNNDQRSNDECSSLLDTKKESSLLYSINSAYLDASQISNAEDAASHFDNIEARIVFTENQEVMNYRLKRQKNSSSEINYYANIDKLLYNTNKYSIVKYDDGTEVEDEDGEVWTASSPVLMRYRSTTHYVVALSPEDKSDGKIPILPYVVEGDKSLGQFQHPVGSTFDTFWGDKDMEFEQGSININDKFGYQTMGCLWLAEFYKEPVNRFGGTSRNALRSNSWIPAGESVDLFENGALRKSVTIHWTTGDTYYQRYDCLKTYAYSTEDANQLVEILSFMCETRTNIDGRYDRNRGQIKNYMMRPDIFNLVNPVYTQQDNFFVGRKLMLDEKDNLRYPNQIYFSKTRNLGSDVDIYTNVTLGSSIDVDGDKGDITSIQRLNDQLLVFQDSGLAQIMYNENVQIATQQGVPIEIANSGKVQGVRYLSDTVGCSNKWSVTSTPNGIYFIDSHNKELYLFNGKLENVSTTGGFNTWMKKNIPSSEVLWNPEDFKNIVAYYDKLNHDVMFINKETCLNYSEKSGTFTSFYDYGNVPYFCNLLDTGLWITKDSKIHKHQAGNYCEFFGENKPYWTTMIANADGMTDKLFTNLEFTASVDSDGEYIHNKPFSFLLPFDYVESWNDHQHGMLNLQQRNGADGMRHYAGDSFASLKRKFRLWRCDVPRDNASLEDDEGMNISRYMPRPLDRMRNPWIYFKLQKNADDSQKRMELHNILMTYYV